MEGCRRRRLSRMSGCRCKRASARSRCRHEMESINCGFVRVEQLANNVGYLNFNMFADPEVCGPTGVEPDVKVPAPDALTTALELIAEKRNLKSWGCDDARIGGEECRERDGVMTDVTAKTNLPRRRATFRRCRITLGK